MTTAAKGSFVDNEDEDDQLDDEPIEDEPEDVETIDDLPDKPVKRGDATALLDDPVYDNQVEIPKPDISLQFELPRKLKLANKNFDRFDRDQSTWLRVLAYRMMIVDGADQPTVQARLDGLDPDIITSWKRDAELNLSKFVQLLVEDMNEHPDLYTAENVLLACKRQGIFDEDGRLLSALALGGDQVAMAQTSAKSQLTNRSTFSGVDALALQEQQLALENKVLRRTPVADVGALLLLYLTVSLETLAVQAEFMKDLTWLRGQKAGDLALLHNAMSQHTLKILEAMTASKADPLEIVPGTVDDVSQNGQDGTSPATSTALEGETMEEAAQNHNQTMSP